MKWDRIITEPCRVSTTVAPSCPRDDGTTEPPGPPTDTRCSDKAFRLAHPEICDGYPVLLIKPAVLSICALQSRKLKVFLYANNTEVEITTGVTWTSSDQGVVLVGAISGKITGIGRVVSGVQVGGIATVSAQWNGQTAFTQVTVLPGDCCDETKVGIVVVVDNSLSMTQSFNSIYATKLAFSKTCAYKFVSELNTTKDVISLMTFNEAGNEILSFGNDVAALKVAVTAITSTTKSTNIGDAVGDAIKLLEDDATITRRVIVLFTDGENREGVDPVALADAFEETGGIIEVVGVRSFGQGFDLLSNIATGGFFLNAHTASYQTIPDQMSGLKGYYCAGNCTPPGDVTVNYAQLNYVNFSKWTVVQGTVDLIGGTPPYDLYDLLPGNGLYVDMAGSGASQHDGEWKGKIESKASFTFLAGTTYRIAFKLAGNQREASEEHYRVRVVVGNVVDDVVTIDDYAQDFTEYFYEFTGPGSGKISFELTEQADVEAFGLLLDDVSLIANPDSVATVVFEDDFDDENAIYIPPICGPSAILGQGFGYECYGYGCLSEPLGVQTEDPLPQPDLIEGAAIPSFGGGGGAGGFDPAGLFPTQTYLDQQLALMLQQAKDYADSLVTDTAKVFTGLFTDPNGNVTAEKPAVYYSLTDFSLWVKTNDGLNDTGWLLAQGGVVSNPTDLQDEDGQPLMDEDGAALMDEG